MTKYPKAVWVGFNPFDRLCEVAKTKSDLAWKTGVETIARYHLHPGNDVARAKIVKDLNYLYECPSRMGAAMVAKRFGVGFKGMRFV